MYLGGLCPPDYALMIPGLQVEKKNSGLAQGCLSRVPFFPRGVERGAAEDCSGLCLQILTVRPTAPGFQQFRRAAEQRCLGTEAHFTPAQYQAQCTHLPAVRNDDEVMEGNLGSGSKMTQAPLASSSYPVILSFFVLKARFFLVRPYKKERPFSSEPPKDGVCLVTSSHCVAVTVRLALESQPG